MFTSFLLLLIIVVTVLLLFIIILKNKIEVLEKYIKNLFNIRTNIIPSIFEVSSYLFIRHNDIFKEIIKLRKISFSEESLNRELHEIIGTQQLIHNEMNFIFKVCTKHHKLLINGKFIYLRESIIKNSTDIGYYLDLYKNIIYKYNILIKIKNYTFIGILIPIGRKENI